MRMPFGQFRGTPVEQLPNDYLVWLSQLRDLRPPLSWRVRQEFANRERTGWPEPDQTSDGRATFEDNVPVPIIQKWFRELVRKHHPDRAGSNEIMAAITAAKDRLLELLAENEGARKAA